MGVLKDAEDIIVWCVISTFTLCTEFILNLSNHLCVAFDLNTIYSLGCQASGAKGFPGKQIGNYTQDITKGSIISSVDSYSEVYSSPKLLRYHPKPFNSTCNTQNSTVKLKTGRVRKSHFDSSSDSEFEIEESCFNINPKR